MRLIILNAMLAVSLTLFISCDSDHQSQAQAPEDELPEASPPPAMTVVSGTIDDPGSQCDGMLSGFDSGDSVTVTMDGGMLPTGKIENNTKGTSVDCSSSETVTDELPLSLLVCESANSTIPAFTNGNFMSMLVDYSWKTSFLDDEHKSIIIIAENIDFLKDFDTSKVPCAFVKINRISASD